MAVVHREPTAEQREAIQDINEDADNLKSLLASMEVQGDVNMRFVALARTQFQTGFMYLRRAVMDIEGADF